jgi:hypothetical protein
MMMPPIEVNDGDYNHYATNAVILAMSQEEAEQQSFDLTGDGTVDLGLTYLLPQILPIVAQGVDVNAAIAEAITVDGSIVLLHSVRANALSQDSSVSWQVYLGNELTAPLPADQYTGNGSFSVSASSPTNAKLTGRIGPTSGGSLFNGGPGTVSINLALEGLPPLTITLVSARIRSTVTATGGTGSLGGAITTKSLREQIFPFAVMVINDLIAEDPDAAGTIIDFLDNDAAGQPGHGTIELEDLQNNALLTSVINAYQIDLLNDPDGDGEGPIEPDTDGTPDSIPLAVGFSFVPAKFTAAGETGVIVPAP